MYEGITKKDISMLYSTFSFSGGSEFWGSRVEDDEHRTA
jgi:hypothetical protein